MIDEELYRKATEELNSEHRRTHVWARACELADDDHDEARYLYTSLRVEELLAERSDGEAVADEPDMPAEDDAPIEPAASDPRPHDGDSGDDGRILPVPAGGDARSATLSPGVPDEEVRDETLDETLDEGDDALWSESTGDDGERTVATRAVATIDPADDPEHAGPDADVLTASRAPSSGALDDLDWLDEAYREERRTLATPPAESNGNDDELTREFRRQAEELPGGRGSAAVIAHDDTPPAIAAPAKDEPGTDGGHVVDASPVPHEAHGDDEVREARRFDVVEAESAMPPPNASPVTSEAAPGVVSTEPGDAHRAPGAASVRVPDAADDLAAGATVGGLPPARDDEPLELADDGAGDEEYAVFSRDDKRWQAVRQGGSWGAMLLTLPWLLHRHLVGTAVLYTLLAVTVLVGLGVTGFAWHDAGADASLVTRGAAIGFASLALVGLFVVPFRSANHWREDKLERRGFELVAYVRARGASRALALARQATSGTR